MDVFLVSAFTMFNKKKSQPLRSNHFKSSFLARLISTRGHPWSSCKKGTRISKMSALQRVGGEVCNYMCVYVCDVWEYMCMHIHVCDQWTVTQLHIQFEGCSIMLANNNSTVCLEHDTYPKVNTNHNHKQSGL